MSKKTQVQKMVEKKIKQLNETYDAELKKFIEDNHLTMMQSGWSKPGANKMPYITDIDDYIRECQVVDIDYYTEYVTQAEIDEFKTKTWPKLYAKWKRTSIEPEKQALRDEIANLQAKLNALDAIK